MSYKYILKAFMVALVVILSIAAVYCKPIHDPYPSDQRFKNNIEPVRDALEIVKSLQGVTWEWRHEEFPDRRFSEEAKIGFIAQDLEKILPELVVTGNDGYKMVYYSKLTTVLTEAIIKQQAIIETMRERQRRLEESIDRLEKPIP